VGKLHEFPLKALSSVLFERDPAAMSNKTLQFFCSLSPSQILPLIDWAIGARTESSSLIDCADFADSSFPPKLLFASKIEI
jgi:hypothetical protein